MTVGVINSGINGIQVLKARQAFENINKLAKKNELTNTGFSEEDVKLSISSQNINIQKSEAFSSKENIDQGGENKKYINEIKEFIGKYNNHELQDEDIKDAMMFGKSILADYTA